MSSYLAALLCLMVLADRGMGQEKEHSLPDTTMAYIPAGTFSMGSNEEERDRRPVHQVYLDAFYMDRYEVTVAQFQRFKPDYKSPYTLSSEGMPVRNVPWHEAKAYCESMGKRLPTEAEWESACRGPEGYTYSWGDKFNRDKASVARPLADGPVRTGLYAPNSYGLYDMSGNVSEWVVDWYDGKYYRISSSKNPKGPDSGEYKVFRGGAWDYSAVTSSRCGYRNRTLPSASTLSVGFRCVRDARAQP